MTKLCNTCEYLKFCARSGIEEVGCDRYKRDTTTNEEWLRSCPPQELIRFLMNVAYGGQIRSVQKSTFDEEAEKWSKWLKEKHQ